MFIARIVNNALLGPALRLMSLRTLALLTSVMVMASYVMWALAYLVPSHPFYLLAASRAIDGLFGSEWSVGGGREVEWGGGGETAGLILMIIHPLVVCYFLVVCLHSYTLT